MGVLDFFRGRKSKESKMRKKKTNNPINKKHAFSNSTNSNGEMKEGEEKEDEEISSTTTTVTMPTTNTTTTITLERSAISNCATTIEQMKKPLKWSTAIEELFDEYYADPEERNIATMEGISIVGKHLGIDVCEDYRILVLLWKLCAKDDSKGSNGTGDGLPGQITKSEFLRGCDKLQVTNLDTLQKLLPSLDVSLLGEMEFKDYYKFCFTFNCQGTHRSLDKESAIGLIKIILTDAACHVSKVRVDDFCAFLESQGVAETSNATQEYQKITLDQWIGFLEFCLKVSSDLSNYSENDAWPVIIDEFVEYLERKN